MLQCPSDFNVQCFGHKTESKWPKSIPLRFTLNYVVQKLIKFLNSGPGIFIFLTRLFHIDDGMHEKIKMMDGSTDTSHCFSLQIARRIRLHNESSLP